MNCSTERNDRSDEGIKTFLGPNQAENSFDTYSGLLALAAMKSTSKPISFNFKAVCGPAHAILYLARFIFLDSNKNLADRMLEKKITSKSSIKSKNTGLKSINDRHSNPRVSLRLKLFRKSSSLTSFEMNIFLKLVDVADAQQFFLEIQGHLCRENESNGMDALHHLKTQHGHIYYHNKHQEATDNLHPLD